MMTPQKNRLGRGLDLLLQAKADFPPVGTGRPLPAPIDLIDINPDQPRQNFDERELSSLAQSLRSMGVVDPLEVWTKEDGRYELIDGERRLKAASLAGLKEIPVIIRDKSDDPSERLRLALVHNLCRADLNPMEEAEAFGRLEKEFGQTHQQIAEMIGRERSTVTNSVRLLKLPENIKDDIRYGRLTPGHGRALLGLADQGLWNMLREDIIIRKLSVRQVEYLIKRLNKRRQKSILSLPNQENQAYYQALAADFSRQLLGLKVKIDHQGTKKKVEIFYTRQEELEWLMEKMGVTPSSH